MGMQCAVCGKKPSMGNHYARRGKAKYLGGVGRKVTGISRRTFRPNLQSIQVDLGGVVQRRRVCIDARKIQLCQLHARELACAQARGEFGERLLVEAHSITLGTRYSPAATCGAFSW